MLQPIIAFRQDSESHWVADLACGHSQHVRHDPPWQVREWVTTEATRREHIGTTLDCPLCELGLSQQDLEATDAYRDARIQGLCHDGALEVARKELTGEK